VSYGFWCHEGWVYGMMSFDPIDWSYLEALKANHIGDIADYYFRCQVEGAETLPDRGPVIIAPNHSGNAMPYDAIILDYWLWRRAGFDRSAKFRSVFTPALTAVPWMRPYGIDNWWRRVGGVDMTFKNFEALLQNGHHVIYYPEGVPGIGKGFNRRYQLQHFHSSFVFLGAKLNVPVHLVSVVNAEWFNPLGLSWKWLNRFSERVFKIPFLPMPAALLALLFPFVFYLAFPGRLVIRIHPATDMRQRLRATGETNLDKPRRQNCLFVAEQLRKEAQDHLDLARAAFGKKPWDLRGLVKSMRHIRGRATRATPFGWPFTFIRCHRDLTRPAARTRLGGVLRDWDILLHFVPFGWPLIALARTLRRPPYGYRGLTKEERDRASGRYRWVVGDKHVPLTDPPSTTDNEH